MLSNKIGNTHCPTSFNCHNIKRFLSMAFLGTFIFAFTIIIGSIVFANDTYDLTPVIVVALVCLNVGKRICDGNCPRCYEKFRRGLKHEVFFYGKGDCI